MDDIFQPIPNFIKNDIVPLRGRFSAANSGKLQLSSIKTRWEIDMKLKDYFEITDGTGVLATADKSGKVDAAVYSRPHVFEDGSVAFIMRDRLTYNNLKSNPHAAYLFIEKGPGYKGKRLFLTKIREEKDTQLLKDLKKRHISSEEDMEKGPKFLVIFKIDKELPLVGAEK
jgi:hypothetical protein